MDFVARDMPFNTIQYLILSKAGYGLVCFGLGFEKNSVKTKW
jgi:hypothetical protein